MWTPASHQLRNSYPDSDNGHAGGQRKVKLTAQCPQGCPAVKGTWAKRSVPAPCSSATASAQGYPVRREDCVREARRACKPGSVSRENRDGDHLSSPPALAGALAPVKRRSGRRCRRGRAANPGTSRALIVPLFGLAPGGVWPPLRHRSRPGALTARFHPYPGSLWLPGRYVSAPLSVPRYGLILRGSLGVTQHPARWSPDFPPRLAPRGTTGAATRPAGPPKPI